MLRIGLNVGSFELQGVVFQLSGFYGVDLTALGCLNGSGFRIASRIGSDRRLLALGG